jgi:CPA1 family monovalent cation:H+ antiporter
VVLLLGLAVGYLGYKLIASIDHYQVEVLISRSNGRLYLCHYIHVSGPLAMVAAGLIIEIKVKS